jgi:hypothetical protein
MSEQFAEVKTEQIEQKTKLPKGVVVKIGISVLVVGLLALGYFLYAQSQNPEVRAAAETATAVEKIGRLIALPEDETPTLATVTDPEKLKDQPFFTKAEVGFQVLFYVKSQKAFLYDPKKDIIVEVATLNLGQ